MEQTNPLTLGQILTAQSRLQPNRVAVSDLDRSMSFRQWNTRACQLANALKGLGLNTGDRIAVFAYNRIEWVEIYIAAAKSGLIVVPVNFRLTGPEVIYILEDCEAAALIVEGALIDTLDVCRDAVDLPDSRIIAIVEKSSRYVEYGELLAGGAKTEPDENVSIDDPWCVMYTSGTTGRPKGAIRNHRSTAMLSLMTQVELKIDRNDHAMLVMPMCHANSLYFFAAFVYCGAAITIFSRPNFDAELCLQTLCNSGATFTSLVPTQYIMMLDIPAVRRETLELDRIAKLMVSSAPARVETKRAIMAMFPNSQLFELYGSTEAAWVTMLHPDEQFEKLGSVGREVVGSAPIKLIDEAGHEVADGDPGELYSCSPYNFSGYWNLPSKTAEVFNGNYLTVGDIAVRDQDGFITLIDRKKNIIITGGENVYPSEVEIVLASHDAVKDVAVVGKPDTKWGEQVVAAVVCHNNITIDERSLLDWAKDRLAGFKRPRQIAFLTDSQMPRNATGKILHRELRDMFSEH